MKEFIMIQRIQEKLARVGLWLSIIIPGTVWLVPQPILGQGRGFSEKRGHQTINLSVPIINLAGETTIHGEYNLAGEGGLALEISSKKDQEESTKSDQDLGVSRLASAQAIGVHYAHYGEPFAMGGFYWGLGAGYRRESIDWMRPENAGTPDFAITENTTWQANLAQLEGPTAHGRVGYRYVGKEMPLLIGTFAGLRHFAAKVSDMGGSSKVRGKDHAEKVQKVPSVTATEMTEKDMTKLSNIYATRIEGGIEVGFSF